MLADVKERNKNFKADIVDVKKHQSAIESEAVTHAEEITESQKKVKEIDDTL